MIIVGAKGFAKEVLEVVIQSNKSKTVVFYDDVEPNGNQLVFEKYSILKSEQDVVEHFKNRDKTFTLGIGNSILRKQMYDKFVKLGGQFESTVSKSATLGGYEVNIGKGTNILPGAILSNSVSTGIGCIIYYNAIVTHDVIVGNFVEISPAAVLLGRCHIGNYSQIGANATILPDIHVGNNVIVAAGAVVTQNVPDNHMVAGVPALMKTQLKPLNL